MRRAASALVLAVAALAASAAPAWGSAPKLGTMLLSLGQMPAGWTVQPSTSGGLGCLHRVLNPAGSRQTAQAEVTFQASSGLPEVIEKLVSYAVPVEGVFNKVVATLSACKTVSGLSGGAKVTGTVARIAFPTYGDQSVAFGVVLKYKGTTLGEDVVIARQGTILVGLTDGTIGAPNLPQFEHFAKLAVAKVH
jgi:hypothetical protein